MTVDPGRARGGRCDGGRSVNRLRFGSAASIRRSSPATPAPRASRGSDSRRLLT